jgi:hypothetical protein
MPPAGAWRAAGPAGWTETVPECARVVSNMILSWQFKSSCGHAARQIDGIMMET